MATFTKRVSYVVELSEDEAAYIFNLLDKATLVFGLPDEADAGTLANALYEAFRERDD